jgi:signal transduction histidine kinase/ActR/RegA family two-component response regulator
MLANPVRLGRLSDLRILDTPADVHFDAITRLTAHMLQAPRAFINFVDGARTWCKSAWGAARAVRRHAESLCAMAVQAADDVVIFDATMHEEVKGHPEFSEDDLAVFYMAFVIRSADGYALGTLCIKDVITRDPAPHELATLRLLGEQVALLLAKEIEKHNYVEVAQHNRDQFLAMLAHELRAPMAPILTAIQVLTKFNVSIAQREWAKELIGRHVKHMGQLVDHLLSTSLVSLGEIKLNLEPLRVNDLLDQSLEMTDVLIAHKNHRLTRTVIDDPWVMADRVQCPLILVNLIMNAAKYTPDHGQIDIHIEGDGALLRASVKDTGVGIAPEDHKEIFELFGQTKRGLDRTSGGMGLGLSLARKLAQWHGGSLEVHSEGVGKGSEFVLLLKQAQPLSGSLVDEASHTALACRLDIVVIDDNSDAADALALYCQMLGHTVRTAYRSIDALNLVAEQQPDVVLSDIGLPEIDGYALVRRMRSMTTINSTSYVAITGYGSDHDRQAALQAGFDQHFAKPLDLRKLDRFLASVGKHDAGT